VLHEGEESKGGAVMTWGFDWLLSFINGFWGIIVQVFQWLIQGVIYALQMGLYVIWDGILTCMSTLISGLNLGNIATQTAAAWGLLPSQLAYLIEQSGIANGLGMIGTGIAVRMALNLIPSWITRI
jgi:F0F1-type ATP synthase membrane subunit c/vacuolar-type H+-ATPase subunit K